VYLGVIVSQFLGVLELRTHDMFTAKIYTQYTPYRAMENRYIGVEV